MRQGRDKPEDLLADPSGAAPLGRRLGVGTHRRIRGSFICKAHVPERGGGEEDKHCTVTFTYGTATCERTVHAHHDMHPTEVEPGPCQVAGSTAAHPFAPPLITSHHFSSLLSTSLRLTRNHPATHRGLNRAERYDTVLSLPHEAQRVAAAPWRLPARLRERVYGTSQEPPGNRRYGAERVCPRERYSQGGAGPTIACRRSWKPSPHSTHRRPTAPSFLDSHPWRTLRGNPAPPRS